MSSTNPIRFVAECRDCGKTVRRPMPTEYENTHGIHVFCSACETSNWAEKRLE